MITIPSIRSWKILSIIAWNVARELHILKNMTVRRHQISDPVQAHSTPQTPLYIPPHRHGRWISEPSLEPSSTWWAWCCGMTFWTHYILILFLIQLFHYQTTLLFIIPTISVFRFISPQPSRGPHPFLFGPPASSAAVALTHPNNHHPHQPEEDDCQGADCSHLKPYGIIRW